MKKFFPIVIIVLTGCLFTSCKKDYTCTCKITPSSGATKVETFIFTKTTNSKATDNCNAQATILNDQFGANTTTCSL